MAVETYVVQSLTTEAVPPNERADYWHAQILPYQPQMDVGLPDTHDVHCMLTRQRTATYHLGRWQSSRITYTRTPRQVRQDPDEDYRFVVPITGRMAVRQGDREAQLTPGTGFLVTCAEPFSLRESGLMRAITLSIPAREVNGPLNRTAPLAAALDLTSGLGRVVHGMITGLCEERDSLTSAQFDAVSTRIVELLCMLSLGDDRPDAPGHLAEVEALVRQHAREHAGDPELTGEAIAQALGWSLRQVQLALQRVGTTPRELIREERLRQVRERLRSPAYAHVPITDLAYASGFSSASALSTAFRQRFGESPRETRSAAWDTAARPDTETRR